MLKSVLCALAVAATLAGGMTAGATPAAADGFRVGVTIGRPGVAPVRTVRHHQRPLACTAGYAVRKAGRFGIRRAYVRHQDRRSITVAGRSRRDRAVVRFARARGCPVISYRRR